MTVHTGTIQQVHIDFRPDFAARSADRQAATLSALANLFDIPAEWVKLRADHRGAKVDLAADPGEDLPTLLHSNSGSLRLLGVERVMLAQASGNVQVWVLERGQFYLAASIQLTETNDQDAPQVDDDFEPVPRIWLFHVIYLVVTTMLAASMFQYSASLALSMFMVAIMSLGGVLLARLRHSRSAHILALTVGVSAPIILCTRMLPYQTIIFISLLVLGIFLARRTLF